MQKFNTTQFTYGLSTIEQHSRMHVQEDVYDTPRIQRYVWNKWIREKERFAYQNEWNMEQKLAYALKEMVNVIEFAFNEIPFYHEFYSNIGYETGAISSLQDLTHIPTLNKSVIKSVDPAQLVPRSFNRHSSNIFWSSTSGSSGASIQIPSDLDSVALHSMTYYRLFNRLAGAAFTPDCWIYNIHHIRCWPSSLLGRYRTFTLNDVASPSELVRHLEHLRPIIINTLPSYLPLLKPYRDRIRALSIKAIITNSEASSCEERRYYSELFSTPIYDEYSSEEAGIIALECPHGYYHLQFDHIYCELKDLTSAACGLAKLYTTDFLCRTMPFIRYDHGDIVSTENLPGDVCACGQSGRVITAVDGRMDDCLKGPDGRYIPSGAISNNLDTYFNASPHISSFRLIQRANFRTFVFMYTGSSLDTTRPLIQSFFLRLESLLNMKIDHFIQHVDVLPENRSYKRKKIISEAAPISDC